MQHPASIVALSWPFVSGWMLLFGLAAAIPIIIHLWNRRRHRELPWAAMTYLLAALRKHARRIRIEQLILLALRVLILLVLALALADPFLESPPSFGTGFSSGGQTHWVLVIDGSYSMDYKTAEKTRFELAKQLAGEIVADSTQGDGFTLVLMSDPPHVIVQQPAFSRDDILEELDNLKLRHAGGDLRATLANIEQIVEAAREQHPRLASTKVCIFTDMGRTTWDEVASAECRRQVARLAERAQVIRIDVAEPARENLAVTRLQVSDPLVTASRDVTVAAEVQNFGSQDRQQQKVEFIVDGKVIDEQFLDVDAGGQATASTAHRFLVSGEHRLEVRAAGDALDVDNHRWAAVPVRDSIRVLCIEGTTDAAHHVALALEPGKGTRPRVIARVASETAIIESRLSDYDCVFLCNVSRFTSDEAAVLNEFLQNGGGLVFFLGDQVRAENYNEVLGAGGTGDRLLPVEIGEIVEEAQYSFDPLGYRHPIVAPFRDHTKAGLLNTPVWKYFRLTPYDETTAKVALAFSRGDAAIVEEKIGRGRVIVFAGAASGASVDRPTNPPTPWSAFHQWPSFPPIVQEMLQVALSGRADTRNLSVGDFIVGVLHGTVGEVPLTIADPDGTQQRVEMTPDADDMRWIFGDTYRSGIYQAELGSPVSDTLLYAINVDTKESDLARFDAEMLPSQFSADFSHESSERLILPTDKQWPVFQFMLLLLLLLLLLEMVLAWYFGRVTDKAA